METISLHGKRMLQEFDQKCWCYNRVMSDCCTLPAPAVDSDDLVWDKKTDGKDLSKKFTFGSGNGWTSPKRVAEGVKRDSAMAVINGDSVWWFDMWGGFYQHQEVYDALRASREIYEREISVPGAPTAQALVVFDPENLLLVNDLNERSGTFHEYPLNALGKSGVTYEVCSLNDLKTMDTSRFRLVVLCHPFFLPEAKMALLRKKILNSGRTVLWVYGPAINAKGQWNPENVEKVCGIPYGTAGLQRKDMGDWKSAYAFRAEETVTDEAMRKLAEDAGCHIWTSRPTPVFASSRLVCVHAVGTEPVTVFLPEKAKRATELYTGKTWENTDRIEVCPDGVSTWLWKLEE